MATQAAQFYEETGIKVTVEQIAYSEMHNKIVVDVSSEGGVYDMFATTNYWLPEFYDGGWVIDQQQYLDNPALYNSDFQLDDVSQSLLDANRIDGALLAMPWKFNSQFLYYRTDLLDAAPTNWDEMLEAAQANTNDSTVGISLALSKTSIMDVYLNLLYQNGGTLLSEDLKTCNLDSDEAREALEYLIELSQYTTDGAINNHWDETAAIFAQGGAAMAPVVNTQVGNVVSPDKSMVSDSVGFAELPGKVTSAAASNTWGIAITRNSKNPEAAFLFIQYLMQPDHIKELVAATEGSTIPVRGSLLTDADFSTSYPWFDVMNAIATTPGHAYAYPMSTQTTAIMEVLAGHVQNAIIGAETVDDALNNAKAEIEALL
ncbi:MAG: sugar ABC transporter substrate-binding protein [Anaerolineaceae bacterium]|nr:sugar ABC transporter substrate-binding protein [Anaerolineaceae bacterium]